MDCLPICGDFPFKFDLTDLLARARRQVAGRIGDVTLNLPFISIAVSPKDRERRVARDMILRLRDRILTMTQTDLTTRRTDHIHQAWNHPALKTNMRSIGLREEVCETTGFREA